MLPGTHTHAPRIPPFKLRRAYFSLLPSCLLVSLKKMVLRHREDWAFSNVSVQGSLDNLGLWFYLFFSPFQQLKEYKPFELNGNFPLFQFILTAECLITTRTLFQNSTNCEVRKCWKCDALQTSWLYITVPKEKPTLKYFFFPGRHRGYVANSCPSVLWININPDFGDKSCYFTLYSKWYIILAVF